MVQERMVYSLISHGKCKLNPPTPKQSALNKARGDTRCWHRVEKLHHNATGVVNGIASHPADPPVICALRYLSQRERDVPKIFVCDSQNLEYAIVS